MNTLSDNFTEIFKKISKEYGQPGFYDPQWTNTASQVQEERVIIITPDLAKSLLAGTSSDVQRKVKHSNVRRYAKEMAEGKWVMNNIPMQQDREGNVFDGQHRLLACIASNTPFITKFIKGVDREAIVHTLDVGMMRGTADTLDILQMGKIPHTRTVAGAIEFLLRYSKNIHTYSGNRADTATNQQVVRWVDLNTDEIDELIELATITHDAETLVSHKHLVGLYYIFRKIDPRKADKFINGIIKGIGLEAESPMLYVRNKLFNSKNSINRVSKLNWRDKMVLIIRAWNDFHTNNGKMSAQKYVADVINVPEIAGAKKLLLFKWE